MRKVGYVRIRPTACRRAGRPDDVGERDEEQSGRHEVGDEDRGADGAGHGELEAAEGIAREEAAEERDGVDRQAMKNVFQSQCGNVVFANRSGSARRSDARSRRARC
jgi:hypothetical protein